MSKWGECASSLEGQLAEARAENERLRESLIGMGELLDPITQGGESYRAAFERQCSQLVEANRTNAGLTAALREVVDANKITEEPAYTRAMNRAIISCSNALRDAPAVLEEKLAEARRAGAADELEIWALEFDKRRATQMRERAAVLREGQGGGNG